MELLFEAKALYAGEYALYNIYRLDRDTYKAQLITDTNGNYDSAAPMELVVAKQAGKWRSEDSAYGELGATLGIEIDAFNNGYGALLGRIGMD